MRACTSRSAARWRLSRGPTPTSGRTRQTSTARNARGRHDEGDGPVVHRACVLRTPGRSDRKAAGTCCRTPFLAPFEGTLASHAALAPSSSLAVLGFLGVLAGCPSWREADIYKYTDAEGVVHFTNTPGGDKRYRVYIHGNGASGKPGSPRARRRPRAAERPRRRALHPLRRLDPRRRRRSTRSPSSSSAPSSGARATTTRAPSASRARAA